MRDEKASEVLRHTFNELQRMVEKQRKSRAGGRSAAQPEKKRSRSYRQA